MKMKRSVMNSYMIHYSVEDERLTYEVDASSKTEALEFLFKRVGNHIEIDYIYAY
jgi:hypothetical protein